MPSIRPALLLALFALSLPALVFGGPELKTGPTNRGVVTYEPYQVFPENRPDNAVYLNNRMVLSAAGEAIVYLMPLPKEGRFAYLSQNAQGETNLHVFLPPTDPAPRIHKVADGVFYVVMVMEGIVYKKLFRVLQGNTVVDLLPSSKTADGATVGETGVLFYHVASVVRANSDGNPNTRFALRLHLVLFEEERLRNLDYPILNTLPSLKVRWLDPTSVEYEMADGRTETISIAQFQ